MIFKQRLRHQDVNTKSLRSAQRAEPSGVSLGCGTPGKFPKRQGRLVGTKRAGKPCVTRNPCLVASETRARVLAAKDKAPRRPPSAAPARRPPAPARRPPPRARAKIMTQSILPFFAHVMTYMFPKARTKCPFIWKMPFSPLSL